MKKYKEYEPEVTVGLIKKILSDLNIITKEKYVDNEKFQSCRIEVGNSKLSALHIGTNGKGRSFEYSLASGYAEFLERMQNNMILFYRRFATKDFLKEKHPSYVSKLKAEELIFDYYYDENEEYVTLDYVIENCGYALMKLTSSKSISELYAYLLKNFGSDKYLMVPFYSVYEKKEVKLPLDVVLSATGSNGMAAGNTNIEAILQSFCEIFERYAMSKIYYSELTPPTIPHDYFIDKSVYDKLEFIEAKTNYKVIIKDCSLGKGFPVIGILIIDTENQRYNFSIASDFVPEIALERTITEIYQGVKYFKSVPFELLTIEEISNKRKYNSTQLNLERIFVNGSGFWPLSIFGDQDSYSFKGFNEKWGKSNEDDFNYCLNLIKEYETNIYIRNNSKLNFPTFYIVIPGLSQIVEHEVCGAYHNSFSQIKLIRELGNINKEKATKISKIIEENYDLMKYRNVNYTNFYIPNINDDLLDLDIELLEFMLFYYIKDYNKALKFMDLFLKDKDSKEYQYYFSICDFIDLKWIKKMSPGEIKSILDKKYSEELTRELFEDFNNPDLIFQYHNFPNCFNCSECQVAEDCSLFDLLKIEKRMELASAKGITQLDLFYEFEKFI